MQQPNAGSTRARSALKRCLVQAACGCCILLLYIQDGFDTYSVQLAMVVILLPSHSTNILHYTCKIMAGTVNYIILYIYPRIN